MLFIIDESVIAVATGICSSSAGSGCATTNAVVKGATGGGATGGGAGAAEATCPGSCTVKPRAARFPCTTRPGSATGGNLAKLCCKKLGGCSKLGGSKFAPCAGAAPPPPLIANMEEKTPSLEALSPFALPSSRGRRGREGLRRRREWLRRLLQRLPPTSPPRRLRLRLRLFLRPRLLLLPIATTAALGVLACSNAAARRGSNAKVEKG